MGENYCDFMNNGLPADGFDVEFDGIEILTGTVRSVAFFNTKNIELVFIDHTIPVDGDVDKPVVRYLMECLDGRREFGTTIKHLTADGSVAYREKFDGCHIESIRRGDLDVGNKENAIISVVVSYNKQDFNGR